MSRKIAKRKQPKVLILEGELDEREEGLTIIDYNGNEIPLIKEVEGMFELGDTVFVSTFVSRERITYEQVKNDMALMAMGLLDEADYYYVYWSELTGSDLTENFVVGGHNLKEILKAYLGMCIVLHVYDRKSIIDDILQDLES